MTPEEKRVGAFEDFDDLLTSGVPVDEAIIRAAMDNELKPEIFRAIAEQNLGDLKAHNEKLLKRVVNAAIVAEVKLASSKRHPRNAFLDCYNVEDVAANVEGRIGRPMTATELSHMELARKDLVISRSKSLLK